MTMNIQFIEAAINRLNSSLYLDNKTMCNLMSTITLCDKKLSSGFVEVMELSDGTYGVNLLGLLNSICAFNETGTLHRIVFIHETENTKARFALQKVQIT